MDTEKSLTEIIQKAFETEIRLDKRLHNLQFQDWLTEFSRAVSAQPHQLILIIDGVNENKDAKALLRRINVLVEEAANFYPWLKIAFSARPEAWRSIKRRVELNELHYYRSVQPSVAHEATTQTLPLGILMPLFSTQELPLVYQNYQRNRHLQTDYKQLSFQVQKLLNDPLTLKLVADTIQRETCPQSNQSR